jgi:hypothetical protein
MTHDHAALPQVSGFKRYQDAALEYTLLYPAGWVMRANSARPGVYGADFRSADKLVVEVFAFDAGGDTAALAAAAVARVVAPGDSAAGDSRLDAPAARRVALSGGDGAPGSPPLRLAFTSDTITRSGYNVRRKHLAAVTRSRDGRAFLISASARADLMDDAKLAQLTTIVDSFALL